MTTTLYNYFPTEQVVTLPLNQGNKSNFLVHEVKKADVEFFHQMTADGFTVNTQSSSTSQEKLLGKVLFNDLSLDSKYYANTQKWLGYVENISETGFTAILKDLTNGGTDEYSEFSLDEVSPDDRELVKQGAAFYFSLGMGYASFNGTRRKESEIRFQRLADFDQQEIIDGGLDLASELISYFK